MKSYKIKKTNAADVWLRWTLWDRQIAKGRSDSALRRGGGGVAVSQNSYMLQFDGTHVRCLEMTNIVMINFQTSDSGICSSTQTMNGYYSISPRNMGNSYIEDEHDRDHVTGSGGSARAVIADLKLKLAVKEAEIQKLQATAVARAAAQQKHIAGMLGYYFEPFPAGKKKTTFVSASFWVRNKHGTSHEMWTRSTVLKGNFQRYFSHYTLIILVCPFLILIFNVLARQAHLVFPDSIIAASHAFYRIYQSVRYISERFRW